MTRKWNHKDVLVLIHALRERDTKLAVEAASMIHDLWQDLHETHEKLQTANAHLRAVAAQAQVAVSDMGLSNV